MITPREGALAWTLAVVVAALTAAGPASALRAPELEPAEAAALRRDFAPCLSKLKGPYTENFCVCRKSGEKRPVRDKSGRITSPCGNDALFCAAFRAPWAESLARQRVWIGNVFSRDLWRWDAIPSHHDLVRGFVLEKYFVDTNPTSKLAELRAFGGLSGSEYETEASKRLFERYLAEPGFDDSRHFPLAYELQRRYFVRDDLGQVEKVRNMAVRIQAAQPKFKPLRDAIHNQLSASLVPKVEAWRDAMPAGPLRAQVDALAVELARLTSVDEDALRDQIGEIATASLRAELASLLPPPDGEAVAAISSLARLMLRAREAVAARAVDAADARRLVDLDITAAAVLQRRGNDVLEGGVPLTVRQHVELLAALTDAAFGAGQLVAREHAAAREALARLRANAAPPRAEFARDLRRAGRVVDWAQDNATLPYAEVWSRWTLLMPQVATIGDDILRSSPMLLYARVYERLSEYAAGDEVQRHDLFGAEVTGEVRALNPGLAAGRLKVAPKVGEYASNEIVALTQTPADLEPAAGILTLGEGNVLSHVQLLARSLGIPNVVLGDEEFARVRPHADEQVLFASTPAGRVVLKRLSDLSDDEKLAWHEYTKNEARRGEGSYATARKLHIDRERIDLSRKLPIDLAEIRRGDSGRICGPKAAFLGELKHLFPDKVARGLVVPFGAYREFYERAAVTVPDSLARAGIARAGEPLKGFVERSFTTFFEEMVPAGKDPRALADWIAPRLEVIRHSIRRAPLSAELVAAIRDGLDRLGLLAGPGKTRTAGCFVRSDTNVEDLDSFNGAGLNLTLFNMGSLDDIYEALREVWASPFQLRSFSWRQALIDEPLWVLPSVVILESVPSEKSGVLVTCDIETGDAGKMTIATSEGVGGAVDGTSAETLLWSPEGVELLTLYKSPWRNELVSGGGSRLAPSSGRDEVLSAKEIDELVAAGKAVDQKLEAARDASGRPRPWDIEFGFSGGKLWLFQSRPFIGNESVKNVPALSLLDGPAKEAGAKDRLSLDDVLR